MKVYSRRTKRWVDRKLHFGVGNSTKTACGIVLFSRHIMVSLFSANDGAVITADLARVTCKRCLATKETRLRKMIEIESAVPGIFDHDTLCGEDWLLNNALNITSQQVKIQTADITDGVKSITLSGDMKTKDRKYLLRRLVNR